MTESLNSRDIRKLGFLLIWIFLIWFVALGWRPHLLVNGNDGVAFIFLKIDRWLRAEGDWFRSFYDPSLFGGADTSIYGFMPMVYLFSLLGLSSIWICNLCCFCAQALFAFLAVRTAEDWAIANAHDAKEPGFPMEAALLALAAFLPLLAWKLSYGHLTLLLGLLLFQGALSLVFAGITGRTSLVHGVAVFLAVLHAVSFAGHQTLFYSVVFGLPIFLGFFYPFRAKLGTVRFWRYPAGVLLAGILAGAPYWYRVLQVSFGHETIRSTSDRNLIYSYITSTAWQWFTSIFWSSSIVELDPDKFLWHEIHYAIGPALLIVFWGLTSSKWRGGALGLLISGFLSIALSMNLKPISTLLLELIPQLYLFRVSGRSFLVVGTAISVFGLAWVIRHLPEAPLRARALLVAGGVTVLAVFAPPWLREALAWTLVTGFIVTAAMKAKPHRDIWSVALLCGLAATAIVDFKEKLLPFPDGEELLRTQSSIKNSLYQTRPELGFPLNRVASDLMMAAYAANSASAMGLYSISGYGAMPKRLIALTEAIRGERLPVGMNSYWFGVASREARILGHLYHIQTAIHFDQQRYYLSPFQPESRSHGFSRSLRTVAGFGQLADILTRNEEDLGRLLAEAAFVLERDRAHYLGDLSPEQGKQLLECAPGGSEPKLAWKADDQWIIETKGNRGLCPFTISMTFSPDWRAVREGEEGQVLRTFPSQGLLLGLLVPEGDSRIRLSYQPRSPWMVKGLGYLGWLMLGGLVFL